MRLTRRLLLDKKKSVSQGRPRKEALNDTEMPLPSEWKYIS